MRLRYALLAGLLALASPAAAQVTPGSTLAPGTVGNCVKYITGTRGGDAGGPCTTGGASTFTLGSTVITLGGTTTTVAGLTLSGGTLSDITTLPGGGQITAAGELGLLAAPTALLSLGGTYTTANQYLVNFVSTFASSNTANQIGLRIMPTFTPTGASAAGVTGLLVQQQIDSTALSITNVVGINSLTTLSAGYSGTVANYYAFSASSLILTGGIVTNHTQFRAPTVAINNGVTSGTKTNRQFVGEGITAGAAGGTINNRGAEITVPAGGASSGTANNRGIYITGNGGTAAGGTVNNHAIYNESTAPNYFAGRMLAGGAAPTLSSCGTSPAISGDAKAGEVTLGTGAPTGCVITFATAYVSAPYCTVTWQSTPLLSQSYVTSNAAITLTQTATSSNKVNYQCWGQSGG